MLSIKKCKVIFLDSLRLYRNFSCNTITPYRIDLDQFTSFFKNIREDNNFSITSVDGVYISGFKNELIDKGLKKSTVARKMKTLCRFFQFLLHEKRIEANPMLFIMNANAPQSLDR